MMLSFHAKILYRIMSTKLLYISQIRVVARDIKIDSVEEANGQFNDLMIVNGEWVFRFPRYRDGVARLQVEARLLQALRGLLPLPFPVPVYQNFHPPVPGLATMGYKMLPGVPLTRASLEKIQDETVLDRLAGQLADFLRMLHAVPLYVIPPEITGPDMKAQDGRAEWEKMYEAVRQKLIPAMRPEMARQVAEHFETYLDTRALQTFDPTLRHGDFGGSNILWDPGQRVITAVIDFSSCAVGDPAMDLASVSTLGDDFYRRIATRYEPDAARLYSLVERARFYRGTFALMEALDGLKYGDAQAYASGMQEYI
jgi:aminoglycoside 2''-phosphotransferase